MTTQAENWDDLTELERCQAAYDAFAALTAARLHLGLSLSLGKGIAHVGRFVDMTSEEWIYALAYLNTLFDKHGNVRLRCQSLEEVYSLIMFAAVCCVQGFWEGHIEYVAETRRFANATGLDSDDFFHARFHDIRDALADNYCIREKDFEIMKLFAMEYRRSTK